MVPSAKTWRNMPNALPSLERPRASRVRTGSADVIAGLTRGLGVTRGAGPVLADKGGVSGSPPKVGSGARAVVAEAQGGTDPAGAPGPGLYGRRAGWPP